MCTEMMGVRTINHFKTAIDLSFSVFASPMAANRPGRSHQYAVETRE